MLWASFEPGVSRIGVLKRKADVSYSEVNPTPEGVAARAALSDGLLFGWAPDLAYDLTLSPTADGGLRVTGTHTAFPSLEVWQYDDGEAPRLIYQYNAPAQTFLQGLRDINIEMEVRN